MSGEMKTKIEVAAEDRKDATADGSGAQLGEAQQRALAEQVGEECILRSPTQTSSCQYEFVHY